ncbi:MAG: Ig-like domain-containing protein, partial [Nitrososphaerales archaeon]
GISSTVNGVSANPITPQGVTFPIGTSFVALATDTVTANLGDEYCVVSNITTPNGSIQTSTCTHLNILSSGTITVGTTGCMIDWQAINGQVDSASMDSLTSTLTINMNTQGDGGVHLPIERILVDATLGGVDQEFLVMIDGEETNYQELETTPTQRTLQISFNAGAETIEIIGTQSGTCGPPLSPPAAQITSPADGSTFIAPADFTVKVMAADSDGTVEKVELFLNGVSQGTRTLPAVGGDYQFPLVGLAPGDYTLTATATDNDGLTGSSQPVKFKVIPPPKGKLTVTADPPKGFKGLNGTFDPTFLIEIFNDSNCPFCNTGVPGYVPVLRGYRNWSVLPSSTPPGNNTCPPSDQELPLGGDTDGDSKLDPGETWFGSCILQFAETTNVNFHVDADLCLDEDCTQVGKISGDQNCVPSEFVVCDPDLNVTLMVEVLDEELVGIFDIDQAKGTLQLHQSKMARVFANGQFLLRFPSSDTLILEKALFYGSSPSKKLADVTPVFFALPEHIKPETEFNPSTGSFALTFPVDLHYHRLDQLGYSQVGEDFTVAYT